MITTVPPTPLSWMYVDTFLKSAHGNTKLGTNILKDTSSGMCFEVRLYTIEPFICSLMLLVGSTFIW